MPNRRSLSIIIAALVLPLFVSVTRLPAQAVATPVQTDLKDREIGLLKRRVDRLDTELQRERIGRVVFETQLQIAAMRQSLIDTPVVFAPLTPAVLRGIVDDSYRRQYPNGALDLYVWIHELFGAFPEGIDLPDLILDIAGEQAAGLYDPDSKRLYCREDFPLDSAMGKMILAHEITHAMQDQAHDFKGMGLETRGNDDLSIAVLSVAEGEATLMMAQYMDQTGGMLGFMFDLPKMLMMDQSKFNAAPPSIQRYFLFPYIQGMQFFQTLAGRTRQHPNRYAGPDEAVWRTEVFDDPPESTEQIIHPEKYLARELPVAIEPVEIEGMGADARSANNVFGEIGILILLESTVGPVRATTAAAGWGGDRIALAESASGDRRALRWVTHWDTPADADEFADALADALAMRYAGRLEWKRSHGTQMWTEDDTTLKIARPQSDTVILTGLFKFDPKRENGNH